MRRTPVSPGEGGAQPWKGLLPAACPSTVLGTFPPTPPGEEAPPAHRPAYASRSVSLGPPPGGGAAWHRGPAGSRTGDARPLRHRQQGQAQRQGPTFFLSSTLMALASLRKMALPHSRSRRDVNWYHFHFRKAQSASSHSLSVHWTAGRGARGHHGAARVPSCTLTLPQGTTLVPQRGRRLPQRERQGPESRAGAQQGPGGQQWDGGRRADRGLSHTPSRVDGSSRGRPGHISTKVPTS